jgi:flagellar basal-body rod modification protein FlgD
MSTTAPIFSNPAYTGTTTTTSTAQSQKTLDQQDFLNLLITQLKNQDPLDPMKDTEFVAQMANFSSLQQMTTMNTNMEKLLQSQQQQNGATAVSMIGKQITDVNGSSGVVTGVKMADDGIRLVVNGSEVLLSNIREVKNPTN